ncbi:hypothetical protein BpHYR1_033897 [Brachionus plicatilis]|uniref:Uncharacterized protein n=1 Tax=Brachionus plicatilis TaxID=10195 RepID=A0A3M7S6B8_BRAPC|nr:hypothetical protein BpHYR1_033897 [Brachionus plicatilis]
MVLALFSFGRLNVNQINLELDQRLTIIIEKNNWRRQKIENLHCRYITENFGIPNIKLSALSNINRIYYIYFAQIGETNT